MRGTRRKLTFRAARSSAINLSIKTRFKSAYIQLFDRATLSSETSCKPSRKQQPATTANVRTIWEDWCERSYNRMEGRKKCCFFSVLIFTLFLLTHGHFFQHSEAADSRFLPVVINTWGPPFTNATAEGKLKMTFEVIIIITSKKQLLNTLPLCTTVVFVGRRSLKNEAEHNRCYSYSMRCK